METLDLIAGADEASRELASRESDGVRVLLLTPTSATRTRSSTRAFPFS